ncbi:Alpha-xylosidase [Trueperella pyogenes]|uniref:glycoside hydrolase family 31 protein n=1 Tax=Trueperella pyogenes TaxID=1661 RepID=UPI000E014359|nr:TIM-barrel domain-containing protein [Trueperella pyogenes]MBB3025226.1 alpha-glucosidase (family GH31 glycosyl hydrolase) [Trueperella pyogenes]SUO86715.1 Alpha-xylosidase [Trueperella pyogenes]
MSLITHRPRGIEHPYARSLDQLYPAIPIAGQSLTIGATTSEPCSRMRCFVLWPEHEQVFDMSPVNGTDSDAALLAGGEGHLAAAQQAALDADNGWQTSIPHLPDQDATYYFEALTLDGRTETSESFPLTPSHWSAEPVGHIDIDGDRFIPDSPLWLVSSAGTHRVKFALRIEGDEHVVGFGERYDQLDQRGLRLDSVVFEQYKAQGKHHRTYLPMPFAQVVNEAGRAWGFHVETTRRTWYDVAATVSDRILIEVDLGFEAQKAPVVRVNTWSGNPTDVLNGFLDVAGRPAEMPEWIFGLWASGNEWNTQSLVMEQMDRHRNEGIPVSVVVIEAWSDEEGFTIFRDARYVPNQGQPHRGADFTYPSDGAWPDPAGMIRELHERGIKVILWQIPLQKTDDDLGPEALAQGNALIASGHVVREPDGTPYKNRGWWFPNALMPDLSTEAGRQWWTEQRRYLVEDLDIDGFKTDGGEHAWGSDLRYEDGRRGDEGNNLYPVNYARAYGDLLRSAGKYPVTFSRSGFTGSQAHGLYWAGDEDSTWEAFRSSITAGITAGACGILYWGWDLAGFSGPVPEAELYARALAAATFMPIMQYHSEFHHHELPLRDRTPWNVAEQTGCEELVDLARHYSRVREALRPYLVDQTRRCLQTGKPLMRAMFYDHADDPEIWMHPRQYMLGDELLINPVTTPGAATWSTYLPEGLWEDFWSGEVSEGGHLVTRAVGWDIIPVYRRV